MPRGGIYVKNVNDRTNQGTSLKATQPKLEKLPKATYRMALGSFHRKMGRLRAVTFANKPICTTRVAVRSERNIHFFR